MTFALPSLPSVQSIAGTATSLATRFGHQEPTEVLAGHCIDGAVFAEAAALALRDESHGPDRAALLAAADAFRAVTESLDGHPGIPMPAAHVSLRGPASGQPMAEAETALATLAGNLLAALAQLSDLRADPDDVAAGLRAGLHAASALASLTRAESDAGHLR
jgi:hypothetical protein